MFFDAMQRTANTKGTERFNAAQTIQISLCFSSSEALGIIAFNDTKP